MESPSSLVETPLNEYCVVKSAPGKGYGVFAACDIPKGTRVLVDQHILQIPGDMLKGSIPQTARRDVLISLIGKQLKTLTKEQQREFFSLNNPYREELGAFLGIAISNSIVLDPEIKICALFPKVARINHSCRPNALRSYHPLLEKAIVHVVKDMTLGEEITVSYIEPAQTFSFRQQVLKDSFAFSCICEACTSTESTREISDMRLTALVSLLNATRKDDIIMRDPLVALHNAHTAMLLQKDEQLLDVLGATFFYDPVVITMTHGDHARGRVFSEMAKMAALNCYGSDHPITAGAQVLVDDPVRFGVEIKSTLWEQQASEIPLNLDEERFEAWLWRRDGQHEQKAN